MIQGERAVGESGNESVCTLAAPNLNLGESIKIKEAAATTAAAAAATRDLQVIRVFTRMIARRNMDDKRAINNPSFPNDHWIRPLSPSLLFSSLLVTGSTSHDPSSIAPFSQPPTRHLRDRLMISLAVERDTLMSMTLRSCAGSSERDGVTDARPAQAGTKFTCRLSQQLASHHRGTGWLHCVRSARRGRREVRESRALAKKVKSKADVRKRAECSSRRAYCHRPLAHESCPVSCQLQLIRTAFLVPSCLSREQNATEQGRGNMQLEKRHSKQGSGLLLLHVLREPV